MFTKSEKAKMMQIYRQLKNENPKLSDAQLALLLGISGKTLSKWKDKFELIKAGKYANRIKQLIKLFN